MAFFLEHAYKTKKTEKDKRLKEYWKNKLLQDDHHDEFKKELKSKNDFKGEFKSPNDRHTGFKSEFNELKFKSYQDLNDTKLLFSPNSKSESKRSESGYAPSILSDENDRNIKGSMRSPNNNNNNNNINNKNHNMNNKNNNIYNNNHSMLRTDNYKVNRDVFREDLVTPSEKNEKFFARKCYANESVRRINVKNNNNNNNNNYISSKKSYVKDKTYNKKNFNNNNYNKYNNNYFDKANNNTTPTTEWLSRVQQELEQQRKNWSNEVDKLLSPASISDNKLSFLLL